MRASRHREALIVLRAAGSDCGGGSELLLLAAHDLLHQAGELQWEDELGRSAVAHAFERLQVLKRHCVLVHTLCGLEDLLQRDGEAFRTQLLGLAFALGIENRGLLLAFRLKDVGLFVAVRDVDGRLARTGRTRSRPPGGCALPTSGDSWLPGLRAAE